MPDLEAVCAATDSNGRVLTAVESLESKSLLSVDRTAQGRRLRLLETVREYAADLLAQAGLAPAARAAHADHFHRQAAARPGLLPWPPRTAAEAAAVRAEFGNALAALDTLLTAGDGPRSADMVIGLATQWVRQASVSELERLVEQLLAGDDLSGRQRVSLLAVLGRCRRSAMNDEPRWRAPQRSSSLLASYPNP